ncbi:Hypothetical protein Nlim_0437 [Candidatus Nitrosarchaeum limnium SFB1]|jgi:3D (Asp-Asp-Asp) domain-containing protein|uniref:3D domain-containing protein n=1 Tax=Candidatus Nitrosarchaeum limnium SFB1 TaxID=886738 RepID=F3KIY3_9ARCH|nr:Hypothetical protein Nlim_0437 [Candidatus Nitrosarchaeum limnium SFB1]
MSGIELYLMKLFIGMFIVLLVSISIIPISAQNQTSNENTPQIRGSFCTKDWYVTGYFLPVESDYRTKTSPVVIDGRSYNFQIDFLDEVKIQGWGKTNSGDYLGWDDGRFYLNDIPLDSMGEKLIVGSVAVDPKNIEHGKKITIPTLPYPWNEIIFNSNDIGPAIIGKHIDVYTGEGLSAREEAFRITGYNNSVCSITAIKSIKEVPPLKQFRLGISLEKIHCSEGFKLIIKDGGNSSACVKPLTIQKLIERGWAQDNIIKN